MRSTAVCCAAQVRRAARRLGMRRPILWAYVPQAETLIEALDPELVVYHCVDDIAAQAGIDTASFRAAERRFARTCRPRTGERARAGGADAGALGERAVRAQRSRRRACSRARLRAQRTPDPAIAALPRPRIVFTGAIVATKLDLPLLVALARSRPRVVLRARRADRRRGSRAPTSRRSRASPTSTCWAPAPTRQLPDVLRAADAGLIPYARNALTESVFPMKVYEYLAAGLPVVATPLPALADVAEVATAPDAEGIARLLEEAIASDTPERRAARSRAAAAHSWERRVEEIAAAIEALSTDVPRAPEARR